MISSEVQRTLVKSPPELWAEISDPEALSRHLGEFGEIRITRVHPEQKVEWEAPEASGSIVIKPSGWGTKVKLTVTRELSEAASELEPDPEGESEPDDELERGGRETFAEEQFEQAEDTIVASLPLEAHEKQRGDEPLPEPAGMIEPSPQEHEPEHARRLGFFARLFGRRRAARTATEESDVHTPEIAEAAEEHPEPTLVADRAGAPDQVTTLAAETELDAEPAATPPAPVPVAPVTPAAVASASESIDLVQLDGTVEHAPPSDADGEIAAELERAEEVAEEQVTAVLTGVLDRLGAAHHRPFSRA